MHWVNTLLPTAPPITHSASLPHRLCVWDREREDGSRWHRTDRRPERVCVCDCVSETHTSYTATRTHIHSPEKAGTVCFFVVWLWLLGFCSMCVFSAYLVLAEAIFKWLVFTCVFFLSCNVVMTFYDLQGNLKKWKQCICLLYGMNLKYNCTVGI